MGSPGGKIFSLQRCFVSTFSLLSQALHPPHQATLELGLPASMLVLVLELVWEWLAELVLELVEWTMGLMPTVDMPMESMTLSARLSTTPRLTRPATLSTTKLATLSTTRFATRSRIKSVTPSLTQLWTQPTWKTARIS